MHQRGTVGGGGQTCRSRRGAAPQSVPGTGAPRGLCQVVVVVVEQQELVGGDFGHGVSVPEQAGDLGEVEKAKVWVVKGPDTGPKLLKKKSLVFLRKRTQKCTFIVFFEHFFHLENTKAAKKIQHA